MSPKQPDAVDRLVGRNIRIQRLAKGLSQTELATQLGVTFQQVQKYEKGVNRIGCGRLFQIAVDPRGSCHGLLRGKRKSKGRERAYARFATVQDLISEPQSFHLVQAFSEINESTAAQLRGRLGQEDRARPGVRCEPGAPALGEAAQAAAKAASSPRRQAPVDGEFRTGHEQRFHRIADRRPDPPPRWRTQPAQRMSRVMRARAAFRMAGLRRDAVDQRAFDEGRVHRAATHLRIEPGAVKRDRLGEEAHAALGGIVGSQIVAADQARNRGQVHDRPPRRLSSGMACLQPRKVPSRLTDITRRHVA